jgi:hypothetical protein
MYFLYLARSTGDIIVRSTNVNQLWEAVTPHTMRDFGKIKEVYAAVFVIANLFLIFSVIMFSIYLAAPLLGGKLSVIAVIHYGSWIGLALGTRIITQAGRKGLPIRAYGYALLCLSCIVYFLLWAYPLNIILIILSIVAIAISYKAYNRRIGTL